MEVPHLKDNRQAKVLEHIQFVISALMLSSFGYAYKPSMETLLPEPRSDVDVLNLSDENELNMFKAVQANHNVFA